MSKVPKVVALTSFQRPATLLRIEFAVISLTLFYPPEADVLRHVFSGQRRSADVNERNTSKQYIPMTCLGYTS